MGLAGVVGHVVQGTKILLQCKVEAARPAANVTWRNGTQFLNETSERVEMLETKVHENVSKRRDIAFASSVARFSSIEITARFVIVLSHRATGLLQPLALAPPRMSNSSLGGILQFSIRNR